MSDAPEDVLKALSAALRLSKAVGSDPVDVLRDTLMACGWQIAPKDSTEAMLAAGEDFCARNGMAGCWSNMMRAAPRIM